MNDSSSVNRNPLVTIAVLTYNSSEYVLETLESVKNQTYSDIELIVSDDGSSDDSVTKCERWIEENGSRFVRTQVIAENNKGVAVNTNRALYAAHGEWWKDLAGDDIMPPDAVEKHLKYIEEHPDVCYFFGKEIHFYGEFSEGNFKPQEMPFRHVFFGKNVTAKRQYRLLTRQFFGAPTALFGKTDAIKSVGGYNEEIPMTEDGPLYLALTKAGFKLGFMDEYCVYRRIHQKSASHKKADNAILSAAEVRNFERYSWWDLQAENSTPYWKLMYRFSTNLWRKVIENGNNINSFKCRFYDFIRRYFNPYKIDLIVLYIEEFVISIFAGNKKGAKI